MYDIYIYIDTHIYIYKESMYIFVQSMNRYEYSFTIL